jgi:hypothetical protein
METEAQQVLVAGFIEGLNVAIHDSVSIYTPRILPNESHQHGHPCRDVVGVGQSTCNKAKLY